MSYEVYNTIYDDQIFASRIDNYLFRRDETNDK